MKRNLNLLLVLAGVISLFFNNSLALAASSPFSQTDWSGGSGQTSFVDNTKYDSGSSVNVTTTGQITLASTSGWFNSAWGYRKQITFDNADQATNLVDFPVLVVLTTSNFDYSKAKAGGADIRFTDSDGTTALSYEIESWNASGNSYLWVKVPQINASSDTDSIYLYYGNSSASDGQSVGSVWNSEYAMVNHMKESSGTNLADSTSNDNDATKLSATEPSPVTGKINGAQDFDGDTDYVSAANSASLNISGDWTVSGWFKDDNADLNHDTANIITKGDVDGTGDVPYFIQLGFRFIVAGYSNEFSSGTTNVGYNLENGGFTAGSWIHFAAKYSTSGNTLTLYINGSQVATNTFATANDGGTGVLSIGRRASGASDWNGDLDELRIANNDFTADWIAASYLSENNAFNTFGSEEGQYTSPGTLTSSIFDTEDEATWGDLTFSATTPTNTTATVKVRTSDSSTMSGATAFSSCDTISSGSDISSNNCVTDGQRYVQYQIALSTTDAAVSPTFSDISIAFTLPSPSPSPSSSSSPGLSAPSSEASPPVCSAKSPVGKPNLVKYNTASTNADIYFTPVNGEVTEYVLSFGYDQSADNFSGTFPSSNEATIKKTIKNLSPGTIYYVKARGGNGCATGEWSNVLKFTTTGSTNPLADITKLNSVPQLETLQPQISLKPSSPPITEEPVPLSQVEETKKPSFQESFNVSPKISFNPFSGIVKFFQSLGGSVSNQIASLYKNVFTPEPLIITEVKVAEKGTDYAVITWKTNLPANSKVNFGDSYDYGRDFQTQEKTTEHRIVITGLESSKTYFYEVMSQSIGSYAFDARHEFQTN